MFNTKAKKERALQTPLFLKPFRSASPKSAVSRRAKRPGQHGARRRRLTEHAEQLEEKQKFRFTYGLKEKQMRKLFKKASHDPERTGEVFKKLLEKRLDNVVYRMGFAPSRSVARQLVSHGHILVNGKKIKSSSYEVKMKDLISIRPGSRDKKIFENLLEKMKEYNTPTWLKVDPIKLEGSITGEPNDLDISFEISKVVDYYSKIIK
ncbi:MAG: 30S ribosomal protein S4 [Candidatus Harrisonbacteria bacterium CG10_big_fil_rev_8_21_14_0_10_38_8]|uniref:Small ribosomal subunit protein uS4 n=1 Tax=Candidatus Harrisonbacteria bacterium CG10_big_fil_rev_8_21_14_0_10_38_8 TaxID=1974582 RepID=A0A2M6WJQ5_9BACT|nr:MAG: 30S ribosomal protein S4 [Candidatus Harrisonbacteria bacterium CG10_big_fil_rev_8_21_14_0_10_38_8]